MGVISLPRECKQKAPAALWTRGQRKWEGEGLRYIAESPGRVGNTVFKSPAPHSEILVEKGFCPIKTIKRPLNGGTCTRIAAMPEDVAGLGSLSPRGVQLSSEMAVCCACTKSGVERAAFLLEACQVNPSYLPILVL